MKRTIAVAVFLVLFLSVTPAPSWSQSASQPVTSPAAPGRAAATASATVKPGENLVVENIPPIPSDVAETANRYGEFRSAALQDWHPRAANCLSPHASLTFRRCTP